MGDIPVTPRPSIRIAESFKHLAASAAALNEATDEFTKVITPLDDVLQKLNLGVECWVRVKSWTYDDGSERHHEVGYARVAGRWGVALRTVDEDQTGENTVYERWLYNGGPRAMRIAAVEKFPELLDELVKKADKTTRKLRDGVQSAREVITSLENAAVEAGVLKPKKGTSR